MQLTHDVVASWIWFVAAVVSVIAVMWALVMPMLLRRDGSAALLQVETFAAAPPTQFDFTLPIYVISLPVRKGSRLDPLMSRIKQPDPRYEVVEVHAVDGRADVVDDREPFMSPGQAGCFLSHVYYWKKIAKRPEPFALVLEDDALIRLPEMLPEMVELVTSLPKDWDVLYLGGVYQPHRDGHPHTITRMNDKIVRSDAFQFFSHAYVITRGAAAALLEQSAEISTGGPGGNPITSLKAFDAVIPVDEWMTHEDRKVNVYNTDPIFVKKADDGVSDTYDKPPSKV